MNMSQSPIRIWTSIIKKKVYAIEPTKSGSNGSEARDGDGGRKGVDSERQVNDVNGRGKAEKAKCRPTKEKTQEAEERLPTTRKTTTKTAYRGHQIFLESRTCNKTFH